MKRIAIFGATSAIAVEVARAYAAEHAAFFLVARDAGKLQIVADDLRARGAASVETAVVDLADTARHDELVRAAGVPAVVLIAHGTLPEQKTAERHGAAEVEAFEVNATSVISLAGRFATVFEDARQGTIAVIGSVAGDRGRRSNYIYGAAKAAVHAYCEGLRARLLPAGARVVLIKPGWVDTPMTAKIKKNPLFASAQSVGRAIHDAIEKRRETVYVPGFWRWISVVIRMLPARFVKF